MPTAKLLLAVLLSTALLGVPGVAHAQSAGDDQYADPFGPVEPQDDPGDEQPPSVQGQTEDAPPAASDRTGLTTSAPEAAGAQSSGSGETLPRTGFEAWLVAAIGWWALLGGVALRRIATR